MGVFKRASGRWSAQVYDPAVGRAVSVAKYRRDRQGTFRTKTEAKTAVDEAAAEIRRRAGVQPMTVAQWRELWLTEGEPRWKRTTLENYRERTAGFARQYGQMMLHDVTPAVVVQWAAVNRGTISTIKTMFGRAVELELIERNPWLAVKTKRPRRQLQPGWLKRDDIDRMLEASDDLFGDFSPMVRAMILTSSQTMVRPSELFELRTHDLRDAAGPVLDVSRAVTHHGGIQGTKRDDVRCIPLSTEAHDAIVAARPLVEGLGGGDLLFCSTRGTQWAQPTWHHRWSQIRASIGRPDLDYYDLRHFGATWLLEQGASVEDVATMMGHRDGGRLVTQVYGHPDQRFARDRVRQALERRSAA